MVSADRSEPRSDQDGAIGRLRTTTRAFDWFAIVNLSLLLAAAGSALLHRFIAFRGAEHLGEFGVYAGVSVVSATVAWVTLRRRPWPVWLLAAVQVAIVIDFAAGLVELQGGRLYDVVVCGVRFDNVVHVVNSFVAALVVSHITRYTGLTVVLMVLGLGASWEIIEYVVVSRVPDAGGGLYENNLQDLVANLTGATAWWVTSAIRHALGRAGPPSLADMDADEPVPRRVRPARGERPSRSRGVWAGGSGR